VSAGKAARTPSPSDRQTRDAWISDAATCERSESRSAPRRAAARAKVQNAATPFGPEISGSKSKSMAGARPRSRAIDDPQRTAIADDRPRASRRKAKTQGITPHRRWGLGPGDDQEDDARAKVRGVAGIDRRDGRTIVIEQLQQRDDSDVGDSARARRGSERARHVMPPSNEAPLERGQPGAIDCGQHPLLDIHVRDQTAAESGDHRRPSGQAAIRSIRASARIGDVTARRGPQERGVQPVDHRLTRGSLASARRSNSDR
jgi:hypothetical protein